MYVATVCRLGESPRNPLARFESEEETQAARERLTGEAVLRAKEIEGAGERVSVQIRLEFPSEWEPPTIWQTVYQTPPNPSALTRRRPQDEYARATGAARRHL